MEQCCELDRPDTRLKTKQTPKRWGGGGEDNILGACEPSNKASHQKPPPTPLTAKHTGWDTVKHHCCPQRLTCLIPKAEFQTFTRYSKFNRVTPRRWLDTSRKRPFWTPDFVIFVHYLPLPGTQFSCFSTIPITQLSSSEIVMQAFTYWAPAEDKWSKLL